MPVDSCRAPGYPQLLSDLAKNRSLPCPPPPWIWLFPRTTHKIHRNTFASLLKGIIKVRASASMKLGVHHPPGKWLCSTTWPLSEPPTAGTVMPCRGMINY